MTTYTDWQQREMDSQEIKPEVTPRADLVREQMQRITAEALAWEFVENGLAILADDPEARHELQELLRRVFAGEYPEPADGNPGYGIPG